MKSTDAIRYLQKVRPYNQVLVEIDGKLHELTGFKIVSWDRRVPGEEQMQQAVVFTTGDSHN